MYKSKLQEYCQKKAWNLPEYSTTKEGFDHCPQFKATVVVNGSTFSTPDVSKSSKEAQNMVAKLAFDHLTGSLSANSTLPVTPILGVQQPQTNETSQAVCVTGTIFARKNDNKFKEMAHLYKNQLQMYAQKRNLALPIYSSEREGPPHAPRFRSIVTLEEKTYQWSEYFSTLKDAENAAAKVALMELSPDGIQEEDPGVFKNLLQELAQKQFNCLPEYNTTWSGASHIPMFVSTVEINGESFTGQEAKTKKLAEMNAAKVAYTALKERKVKQKSESSLPISHVKDKSYSSSPKLQPVVMAELPPRNSPEPNLSHYKGAHQKAAESEPIATSFDVAQTNCGEESLCSNSSPVHTPSILDVGANIEPWAEPNTSSTQKVVKVYPLMPNMTFPQGTAVLHMDKKWIAVTAKSIQGNE